jgi:exonuclease VII small subunit
MTGANVQSIDALQEWHAALAVFREEALESLAAVALEIQRSESWLDDRLRGWQNEARDAEQEVVQCKTELANRKFVGFDGRVPDCSVQEEALWRAEDRLERAREQIEIVRKWYHKMPKMVSEEYEVAARHMLNFLEGDVPRGLAMLKSQIASLEAYAQLRAEQFAPPPPPAPKEAP